MKISEILMKEVNALMEVYGCKYRGCYKEHLHMVDCMLYICFSGDIKEMIGMELKYGDIFIIIYNYEQLQLYINKDFRYTEYHIWNFSDEFFLPIDMDYATSFERAKQKYYYMMDFMVRGLNDPLIDEGMIQQVMQKHRSLLVIRKTARGDEYDRYTVAYVSGITDSEHLNRTVTSCKKGNIVLVSHYTGYGYMPSRSNTTIHIGIMDVTKEEAEERGLKFSDMYIDYSIK